MSQFLFGDDEYYFQILEEENRKKEFVLIIYDILDNKKRTKFAKMLEGYGNRVQKSAFEAVLPQKKFEKLVEEISKYVSKNSTDDNVRIYRITGKGKVLFWGAEPQFEEDVIVI